VTTAAIPSDSLVAQALDRIDYSDAFDGPVPTGVTNAEELARAIFAAPSPVWVRLLFGIRNGAARRSYCATNARWSPPPSSSTAGSTVCLGASTLRWYGRSTAASFDRC